MTLGSVALNESIRDYDEATNFRCFELELNSPEIFGTTMQEKVPAPAAISLAVALFLAVQGINSLKLARGKCGVDA